MENNRTVLTIAIPTYNRNVQIQKQIRLILPQLTDEVKLVVYDNCSETPIRKLFNKDEIRLFTIIRNPTNIGGDANIARCHEFCDTEWLWVLGDDDFVSNDAVSIVLSNIKEHPNVVWMNFETKITLMIDNSKSFLESLGSIQDFGDSFWISKCIYNNFKLKPYIYYYYTNLSSMVGQIIMVIKYALDNDDFSCLKSDKNIFIEHNPGGWNTNHLVNNLSVFYNAFSYEERKLMNNSLLYGATRYRLEMIRKGKGSLKLLFKTINDYSVCKSLRKFPLLIARKLIVIALPQSAYPLLKKIFIKYIINRKRHKMKSCPKA